MDTCICMADSLCCSSETTTTLLSGYTPIQNKKLITTKHCGQFLDCFHVHNQEIICIKVHSLSNFGQSEKEMVVSSSINVDVLGKIILRLKWCT